MKILEAQSAILTNYEVFTHLSDQRARYEAKQKKRRGPGNLETVVREMLDYLRTAPSPLGSTPLPYKTTTIRLLLTKLRPYNLTKAEFLMIMNLRPTHTVALTIIIEEFELRFPDVDVQQQILDAIIEVLGSPDGEADRQAMMDSAQDARVREAEEPVDGGEEGVKMEVDG